MDSTYLLCFWYRLALIRETYFVCLEINFIHISCTPTLFQASVYLWFLCGIQLYIEYNERWDIEENTLGISNNKIDDNIKILVVANDWLTSSGINKQDVSFFYWILNIKYEFPVEIIDYDHVAVINLIE